MLLYAGKASKYSPRVVICPWLGGKTLPKGEASFKYFLLIETVKKLKQWSLSAGNTFNLKSETSETIRYNTENINNISFDLNYGRMVDESLFLSYQLELWTQNIRF
jgi:hypothetical protein